MKPFALDALDADHFVPLECGGERWLVAPVYISPVGIEEANEIAARAGCELPTPALVDAIWRAADLKISPAKTIQVHDGTAAGMNSDEIYERVAAGIAEAVGVRSLGADVRLMAGPLKDVVTNGRVNGIYGMHVEDVDAFNTELRSRTGLSVPTHPTATRGPGRVVQPVFYGHAASWKDFSQALRLVRRA